MKVTVRTLQAFSGPDGRHPKGACIPVAPERAQWLIENGFAAAVDATPVKAPAKAAGATKTAKAAPRKRPSKAK